MSDLRLPVVVLAFLLVVLAAVQCLAGLALVGSINPGTTGLQPASSVVVVGTYAYLGVFNYGFYVIDVSNPSEPEVVGTSFQGTHYDAYDIALMSDYLYMALEDGWLCIFDVSDPANPMIVSSSCHGPLSRYNDVSVAGNLVMLSGDYRHASPGWFLDVYDVSDPLEPVQISTCSGSEGSVEFTPGLFLTSGCAYIARNFAGKLTIADVSDAADPTVISTVAAAGHPFELFVASGYAYVAEWESGLEVFDVTDVASPVPVGWCDTDGLARGIQVVDCYAFVADSEAGVKAIDVCDPANPYILDAFDTEGSVKEVFVCGDYVYLADGPAGLTILKWTPPVLGAAIDFDPDALNPRSGGQWVTCYIELDPCHDVAAIDVASVLLNDTVPAEPWPTEIGDSDSDGIPDLMVKFERSEVQAILPSGESVQIAVTGGVGGYTFLGMDNIRVLPPEVVSPNGGEILEQGREFLLTWQAPEGYMPDKYSVYYTMDDGATWDAVVRNVGITSHIWIVPDVESEACRLLVEACDQEGFMGYDLSDEPFTIDSRVSAGAPSDGPIQFALHPTRSNPSHGKVFIGFDLPEAALVRLTVHDVSGRLVDELVDGLRSRGSHTVEWTGRPSGKWWSGVYFVRLEAGGWRATRKVVIID